MEAVNIHPETRCILFEDDVKKTTKILKEDLPLVFSI